MKPGVKTTEFWIAVVVIVLVAAMAVLQLLPYEWAATAASIIASVWVVARTVLKLSGQGALVDEAERVRQTVKEEVSFAMAEKQKAVAVTGGTPVLPSRGGCVNWPLILSLAAVAAMWVGLSLFAVHWIVPK